MQALQIPTAERAPEITGLLGALLAKLEKDRGVLQLTKDDNLYCENFALTVRGPWAPFCTLSTHPALLHTLALREFCAHNEGVLGVILHLASKRAAAD